MRVRVDMCKCVCRRQSTNDKLTSKKLAFFFKLNIEPKS